MHQPSSSLSRLEAALSLVVFLLLVGLTAWAGAAAMQLGGRGGYAGIQQPALTPPAWVFGPVWSVLYLLIALAGWRVWLLRKQQPVVPALTVYGLQLALNALWCLLYFGLGLLLWSWVEIIVLWLSILATVLLCWRCSPLAGALLIPYLLWVGFASYLNIAIWWLNA